MPTYLERLRAAIAARGALCVGLDPHPSLLERWGLPDDVSGVERLALGVIAALGDRVAAFKPQSAFFEVFGAAGLRVLERAIADAQAAGALVIVDAKRGDIGSTMEAYAQAYLGAGPLGGDALTVSPYLGFEALAPAFEAAEANGKGVYVLARTSNPEGGAVQLATVEGGSSVVQHIVDQATGRNRRTGLQAIGLVVGGTHGTVGADLRLFAGPILVPGLGAQGATLEDIRRLFADTAATVLPTSSRDVLLAGPSPAGLRAKVADLVG